jgi:outer membrane protein TolC
MQPWTVLLSLRVSHWILPLLVLTSCGLMPPLGSRRLKKDAANLHGIAPEKWAALPDVAPSAATGWLGDYDCAALRVLVDRAIAANPNLKAAAARVTQAQAQTVQAGAAMMPSINGSFSASRSQTPSDCP